MVKIGSRYVDSSGMSTSVADSSDIQVLLPYSWEPFTQHIQFALLGHFVEVGRSIDSEKSVNPMLSTCSYAD